MNSKLAQFAQSLGVSWLSMAALCLFGMNGNASREILLSLGFFHVLNSAVVWMHSDSVLDRAFTAALTLSVLVPLRSPRRLKSIE